MGGMREWGVWNCGRERLGRARSGGNEGMGSAELRARGCRSSRGGWGCERTTGWEELGTGEVVGEGVYGWRVG